MGGQFAWQSVEQDIVYIDRWSSTVVEPYYDILDAHLPMLCECSWSVFHQWLFADLCVVCRYVGCEGDVVQSGVVCVFQGRGVGDLSLL